MAHIESKTGLFVSLAEIEEVNIFLTGFVIREIADKIAKDNKQVTDIPDMSILTGPSSSWLVKRYKEIPRVSKYGNLLQRYGRPFGDIKYYHPLMRYFTVAQRYSGGVLIYTRGLAKLNAYLIFLGGGEKWFSNTTPAAHFSTRSKRNSFTKEGNPTTKRFSIGGETYDISKDIERIEVLPELEVITPKGLNMSFSIRGPTSRREKLIDFLNKNPHIFIDASERSSSLHDGKLSQNITVVLADRYDFLAGDHRRNNIIILNASDIENMMREGEDTLSVSELITSLLSKELAHERGAKGDSGTEENLAQDCAHNTKYALSHQPNPGPLSEYIAFVEKFGEETKGQKGYLSYLRVANRYQDLTWTRKEEGLEEEKQAEALHASWALVEKLSSDNFSKSGELIFDASTRTKIDPDFISALRREEIGRASCRERV